MLEPVLAVLLLASAAAPPAATAAGAPEVTFTPPVGASPALRWNYLARELAVKGKGESFQTFAILSLAQFRVTRPPAVPGVPADIAVVTVSAAVLNKLYPEAKARVQMDRKHDIDELRANFEGSQKDLDSIISTSELIADQSVAKGRQRSDDKAASDADDVSSAEWKPAPGTQGEGRDNASLARWFKSPEPLVAPPAQDSDEFKSALEAVRQAAKSRNALQKIAWEYWAGQPKGEMTPGLWNGIADALLTRHEKSNADSARTLYLMNAAMRDAAISCFSEKYRFKLARPTQVDRKLVAAIHVPNFPAYPSAHACLSGAASEALASVFPEDKGYLTALAEEASTCRVWAGLHYPFDGEAGLPLGRTVAKSVIYDVH